MRITRSHVVAALAAAVFPALASAQLSLDNLQIHGYLTQGYADASQRAYGGIPIDPTGDYRVAALQFRYAATDKDAVVVQLRNRRLGTSPLTAGESDVSLNWAYYQRTLGPVRVKAGKLPIPRGIFNEVRSVGTVLPFYRASYVFYGEGYETVDGASASSSLPMGKGWSLDATGFGGGFDLRVPVTSAAGVTTMFSVRAERVRGGQLWLNTPIRGLRFGTGGYRFRSRKATDTSTTPTSSQWTGSVDGDFNRIAVRGEFSHTATSGSNTMSYYGQGSVRITDKLSLNAQNEMNDGSAATGPGVWRHWRGIRDAAGGASYQFTPSLILKVEQHDVKGYKFDVPLPTTGTPGKGKYFIASLSASF